LLAELQSVEAELPRKLNPETATSSVIEKISVDKETFDRMHEENRMAKEKLAEGIEGFTKALETLEKLLSDRLAALEA
jgi:transaldolase